MIRCFVSLGILQIVLQGAFWSGFWGALIQGALAAVILSFLSWLAVRLIRAVRQLLRARGRYRITGIWIGTCELPRYRGVEAIEIYRLVTKKEHVTVSFFNYLPNVKKPQKYDGAGIYRGIVLSAFYYISEPQSSESGVFVLRKAGEEFRGYYAQYDLIADMKVHVSKEEDFVLTRVREISFWAQIKMMWGFPPFCCYEHAKLLYDEVVPPLDVGQPTNNDVNRSPGCETHG